MKNLYLSNRYLISTILSQTTIAIFVAIRWFNLSPSLIFYLFFFQATWAPERRHGVSSALPFSPLVADPLGTTLIRHQPQRMAIRATCHDSFRDGRALFSISLPFCATSLWQSSKLDCTRAFDFAEIETKGSTRRLRSVASARFFKYNIGNVWCYAR